MKIWVETRLVEPPEHTISGRFGGSVMFVGYFKALNEWRWLQPGGIEEKIAEPEAIFLDEDYVKKHMLKTPRPAREKPQHIHRKRSSQLLLDV
jgi:hypothetical protein